MGFMELCVIAVVGLLVIGPERLPEAIKSVLTTWHKLKRNISDVSQDFQQQLGIEDIQRELRDEEFLGQLQKTKQELNLIDKEGSFEEELALELEKITSIDCEEKDTEK